MPNGLRALRIARTVRHRQKVGPRVTYAVNADGSGEERGIPEQVVLVRWRRRVLDGYVFRRGRLPPSTWRALPLVLGPDVSSWSNLSVDAIRECLDCVTARASGRARSLSVCAQRAGACTVASLRRSEASARADSQQPDRRDCVPARPWPQCPCLPASRTRPGHHLTKRA